MAQQIIKPVMIRPAKRLLHRYLHHLSPPSLFPVTTTAAAVNLTSFIKPPIATSHHRNGHFKARGGLYRDRAPVSETEESELSDSDDSESELEPQFERVKRNRNVKKREARRAVRWGMDLALFSDTQIKRILRLAALEQEVYDAVMLVKRLGRDVREGKRRQYNLIGKLLKNAEPELMDTLIQATKDGEQDTLRALESSVTMVNGDSDEEEAKEMEIDTDDDEEILPHESDMATRWFDGLVNKAVDITKEVYSIHSVDFDRQELRKLVRKVHRIQEQPDITEENKKEVDVSLTGAKKSLRIYLRSLAKRMPIE